MGFKELSEFQVQGSTEIGETTKAFENFDTKSIGEGVRESPDNIGGWADLPPDTTFQEKLEGTNPNYELGYEWEINCQRCVPTFEMRERGYDVTAQPCVDEFDYLAYYPFDVWENAEVIDCHGDGLSDISSQMSEWGDGARAQVVVLWEWGGGHTFTAIQEDGVTKFVDPQTGEADVSYYFENVAPGCTQFCRIDNLDPSSMMLRCCE